MALSQGLQALGESRDSFKQLKAVAVDALKGIKAGIGATGIGLLVVALGTIAANWEDIVIAAKEAFPALNNVGNVFNKLKEYAFGAGNVIKNYILMPFKALGQLIAGDFKGAIEEIKKGFDVVGNYEAGAAKERQNQRDEAAKERLEKQIKDNEKQIEVLKAAGKNTYNIELENIKRKQKLYADDKEKLDQALQEERILRAAHQKQLDDKSKADRLKREQEEKEAREKAAAERKAYDEETLKGIQQLNLLTVQNNLDTLQQQQQDTLDAGIAEMTDFYAINEAQQKADDLAAEQTKVRERAVANAKLDIAQNTISLISEIAGKGSKVGKALALAQATISGYQGVQNAYTTAQASPITIGFPAYPYIQAGLAGAFSLLQIKKIMSTDPSGSSAPNLGGGAGGAGGGATPPSFNVVGSTGVNQLAGAIGNREAAPVQAYVVANNVTTAQSLDRNIIQSATLGG
jgi:hypothetical protein